MKYRVVKNISLLSIAQAGPKGCDEFATEYNRLLCYLSGKGAVSIVLGLDKSGNYMVTTARTIFFEWAEESPKRIEWLIDNGFIEGVEDALKKCPFCGPKSCAANKPCIQSDTYEHFHVFCAFCHARGPIGEKRTDAIKAWNKRV